MSWLCLAALAGCLSCSTLSNCPESQPDVTIKTGKTDTDALVYTSAEETNLDAFPAKTNLRFEHGLGTKPYLYKSYLAFTKDGTNGNGGGSVAEAAGNEVLYECVDSDVIVVRNDTCEPSFFIRLVAVAKPDDLKDPALTNDHTCTPP
jgi:hypothetical protein